MRARIALFLKIYVLLITLLVSMVGTHILLHKDSIFPDPKTVVVYGRNSCGITSSLRTSLAQAGIPHLYRDVDKFLVGDEMWYHLDAIEAQDSDLTYAQFPVVLVNGRTLDRPQEQEVINLFRQANDARH